MRLRMLLLVAVLCSVMVVVPRIGSAAPNTTVISPPKSVSLVGDELTAVNISAYLSAVTRVGVQPTSFSGHTGNTLRYGWRCVVNGVSVVQPTKTNAACVREGLSQIATLSQLGYLGSAVVVAVGTNDAALFSTTQQTTHFNEIRRLVGTRPIYLVSTWALNPTVNTKLVAYNLNAARWCATDRACQIINWASTTAARTRSNYTSTLVRLTAAGAAVRANYIATQLAHPTTPPAPTTTVKSTSTVPYHYMELTGAGGGSCNGAGTLTWGVGVAADVVPYANGTRMIPDLVDSWGITFVVPNAPANWSSPKVTITATGVPSIVVPEGAVRADTSCA